MPTHEMISNATTGLMFDWEKQTADIGTARDTPAGKKFSYEPGESFRFSRQGIENHEYSGTRLTQAVVPGDAEVGGRLSHKLTMDTGPMWWESILGGISTSANAGSGATAGTVTFTVGGPVLTVPVSAGGSGYVYPPRVSFSGGSGSGAEAYAVLTADAVTSVVVTRGGTGYATAPTATFTVNNLHTITPATTVPTFRIQKKFGFSTPTYDLLKGCRTNNSSIKLAGTGYYMLDSDFMGCSFSNSTSNYDGSATDWTGGKKLHHGLIPLAQVKLDDTAVTYGQFLEFTLTFGNNLDGGDRPIGFNGFRAGLIPDEFSASIAGVLRVQSQADVDVIASSTMGYHKLSLQWVFTDTAYWHQITMYQFQFDPTSGAADGRGGFKIPFNGKASVDSNGNMVTALFSNSQAAAAYTPG